MDKWFGLYLVYIVCFGISSALTGYFINYFRFLFGFFFVAYVGYWASHILINKYNGETYLINIIFVIGIIDAIATIGQFYNLPFFNSIPSLIGIYVDSDFIDMMDIGDVAFGLTLPGIMTTDIYNGYFLMVAGILSLSYFYRKANLLIIIPWVLILIASYMTQQRAPFYILILTSLFVIFKIVYLSKSRFRSIYLLVFFLLLPFVATHLINFLFTGESRFNIGMETNNRELIYRRSLEYINENIIFGGSFQLSHTQGFASHNLFLNAWIYGGIIGFVIITWLTIKQCALIIKSVLTKEISESIINIFFGLAFLSFTLNSLLHNASVVTGDLVVWLMWGGFVAKRRITTISPRFPSQNT